MTDQAIRWAKRQGHHDIANMLRLASISGNVGDRIKEKAAELNKERGCIENVLKHLGRIGKQSAEIFEKVLVEVVTGCVESKDCFDDFLLSLCHALIGETHFEASELFGVIARVVSDVITGGTKLDWFWLKEVLLPANVE